jgi:HD-GYP domain-containing protein (c-di-GMP phosphodiesterase class II)
MSSDSPTEPVAARPRPRRRLLWTLLGAMMLVGLLPLAISHLQLTRINRGSMETLEKKYQSRSAVSIGNDIQNLYANNQQHLSKIAGNMRALEKALGADPFPYANDWMSDYVNGESDLIAVRALNRAGQGAEAVPADLKPEIVAAMNQARASALSGKSSTGQVLYLTDAHPAVVMAVPVFDQGKQVIGSVVGLVSLRRIVDRIQEEGKGGVTAFVVDGDGKVIIHSEPSVHVTHPDYSHLKIVQDFKRAPVRLTESYEDKLSGRPEKVIGTVAPAAANLGVIVEKPESTAFASVDQMVKATIQWGAIALILAIIAAIFFASGIARPIRALAQRSAEIAQGNYQQRVELKAQNEIGELADNFNTMSASIEQAVEQLKKAAQENHLLFLNSVRMLAAAIDAKDPYTRGHSERVARYSIAIGKNLQLPQKEMLNLRISALLHDVGKIGIDDRILRKPGALSDEEFEIMKGHPAKGAAIMSGVAQLIDIIPGMKYHHEKWSGGGYPEGLEGEQIPVQARIVAIADTFDAMTTNRPYQKAMEINYVVEKIKSFGGTRFDPRVVDAFVNAVKRGDIQIEEQVRGAA